jgi:hypothetical protein
MSLDIDYIQAAEFLSDNFTPRVVVPHHSQGQAVATGAGALRQSSSASCSSQSEDRGRDEASLNVGKLSSCDADQPACAMLRQSLRNSVLRGSCRRVRTLNKVAKARAVAEPCAVPLALPWLRRDGDRRSETRRRAAVTLASAAT